MVTMLNRNSSKTITGGLKSHCQAYAQDRPTTAVPTTPSQPHSFESLESVILAPTPSGISDISVTQNSHTCTCLNRNEPRASR